MTDLTTEDGVRIEISECHLDSDADISLSEAYQSLDKDEAARAEAFVFERDRARFIRAHGHLRRRLGAFLDLAAKCVPIVVEDGGKPRVAGRCMDFNLSHSGAHAVLAITEGAGVGIDVETADRSDRLDRDIDGLARLCLTDEEQVALIDLSPARRVRRFLSYWTAKEARMKLTGEGMRLEPHTISLELSDGEPVGYRRPDSPRAHLRFVTLSRPDTVCCVAIGPKRG